MTVKSVGRFVFKYVFGYFIACVAAGAAVALVTILTFSGPGIPLFGMLFLVTLLAFAASWPGFMLTAWLAYRFRWNRSIYFAVSGAIAAILAIAVVAAVNGGSFTFLAPQEIWLAVMGGAVGGFAYGSFALSRLFASETERLEELESVFS